MYKTITSLLVILSVISFTQAFDINAGNNLIGYWGQNSGWNHNAGQLELANYCSGYDVINIAFLNTFFGTNNLKGTTIPLPELNTANMCGDTFAPDYPRVMKCPMVGTGTQTCQAAGKIVMLSLGGATGNNPIANVAQAQQFANTLWNMFFGGTDPAYPRPFGAVKLDGLDFDIEGGSTTYYYDLIVAFTNLAKTDNTKRYYISGAPQCPKPDAAMGPGTGSTMLDTGLFDFINIQFYNNYCGLDHMASFNYNAWKAWVINSSPNTKIVIGAAGDTYAAPAGGYVTAATLETILADYINDPTFGGVMVWDCPVADNNIANGKSFSSSIKSYMVANRNPSSSTTSTTTTKPTTTTTTSSPTTTSTTTSSPTTTSTTTTKPTTTTSSPTTTSTSTTTTKPTTTTTKPTTSSTTNTPTTTSSTTNKPTTTTTTNSPTTSSTTSTTTDAPSTTTSSPSTTTQAPTTTTSTTTASPSITSATPLPNSSAILLPCFTMILFVVVAILF
ncbi:hypothetical protein SAMD00019534_066100 [Acytostelium subglobosum LB1]|uniref:hypothetical protein n=1 Tax=Acytostelium subglobosum LB1 TaxID=1410327 RepID=UPI000644C737|nr:hypothetical protein SAMD00019534_066100 [Acytostelium subglobosum LB1]GAM23435.1 hypothetical protein SAMD00019534_066100 [Acytostelium subglobosum LB1]|eukprot:XP_012753884.1 hypothetical protein SAMD00019534_066100 [Acytostelium subglobosum LB1]